jgi:hypothetical protein
MKEYRRFCLNLLLATACMSSGIAIFNTLIDPYGVLNSPVISILNQKKVAKSTRNARLFKAIDVQRIKPVTLFLGTSRAERGLDPKHPVFATEQPVYNSALPAASQYEVMRYFEHAIANQPALKQVIIGVDFFMFNEFNRGKAGFTEHRLEKTDITLRDVFDITFSVKATRASLLTIASNLRDFSSESYRDDGAWISPNHQNSEKNLKKMLEADLDQTYQKYQLYNDAFNDFRSIIETCKQNNIEVKVFISPAHATEWEAIRVAGLWPTFEEWKRELVKITPVWDFSGYNSITTEAISSEMENYLDSSHYSPAVGNLVLNRLYNYQHESVPADFGIWITPQNVETHIKQIRTDREHWASQNSDVVQMVQDIERRVAQSTAQ